MPSVSRIEKYDLPTGARYLRIPHSADPEKGAEWLAEVQREMADTPTIFRQQILMDETVRDGIPVYAGYVDDLHCPVEYQTKSMPLQDGSVIYAGWDCGSTVQPAFCLLEMTPKYQQIKALMEVVSMGGESMSLFVPRVCKTVEFLYPGILKKAWHDADPSARSRSGTDGKTAIQVAREAGISMRPAISNAWVPRQSAVATLLADRIEVNGQSFPRFVVCGHLCPTMRDGFLGDYKLKISSSGDAKGPGAILGEPVKNLFSHVHDSLQYPSMRIVQAIERLTAKNRERGDKGLSRPRRN